MFLWLWVSWALKAAGPSSKSEMPSWALYQIDMYAWINFTTHPFKSTNSELRTYEL